MKHTEGKWIVGRGSHSYPFEILAATKTIAQIEHQEMTETEANAELIAAAPELLEVCEKMANFLYGYSESEKRVSSKDYPKFKEIYTQGFNAINKAEKEA